MKSNIMMKTATILTVLIGFALVAGAAEKPTAPQPAKAPAGTAAQSVKPGLLTGQIRNASGTGQSGMKLALVNAEGERVAETVTGKTGIYRFEKLAEGSYRLEGDGKLLARLEVTPDAVSSKLTIVLPGEAVTTWETVEWTVVLAGGTLLVVATPAIVNHNSRDGGRVSP